MKQIRKGILVVSFGCSHQEAYEKTIAVMEREIQKQYPEYLVLRVWTSEKIRTKLEYKGGKYMCVDGMPVYDMWEAFLRMQADGVEEVVVLPLYVLDGPENQRLKRSVKAMEHMVSCVKMAQPLLENREDCRQVAEVLAAEWKAESDKLIIFAGHGTGTDADRLYEEMQKEFAFLERNDILVGVLEGHPDQREVLKKAKGGNWKKVCMIPFMLSAGVHVNRELAGEKADSWRNLFEKEKFEVECVKKGLGEYSMIRQIFMQGCLELL